PRGGGGHGGGGPAGAVEGGAGRDRGAARARGAAGRRDPRHVERQLRGPPQEAPRRPGGAMTPAELERICVAAAQAGAQVLRELFDKPREIALKGRIDLVTDADRAAEERILGLLR